MEILSADIKVNESHTFSFSKPVQQYMVGFSRCDLGYPRPDHHVLAITIDLSDITQNNNDVIVHPQIDIHDNSKHNQSPDSSITVVVIATVGDGNPNVELFTGIRPHYKNELKIDNPILLQTALSRTYVEYPDEGHHVFQFKSTIYPDLKQDAFYLRGQAHMNDHSKKGDNLAEGKIAGSAIAYNGDDNSVICATFDSKNVGNSGEVCFGDVPEGFPSQDYELGCFITGYDLTYSNRVDHHVLKFEISVSLNENKLIIQNGKAYAKLNLKAFMTDNGKNQFDIPHNSLTGIVLAINNKK